MNDIFKDMQTKIGCEYISDLLAYKRKVWHEIYLEYPEYYEDERILEEEEKWLEEFLTKLPTKKKEYFEQLIKENDNY